MFNFSANNRDSAALRASAIVIRMVQGANFQVEDKVGLIDQSTKKSQIKTKMERTMPSNRYIQ